MRTLLFDGDIIAFQIAVTQEETVNWGDGIVTRWADAVRACQIIDKYIDDVMINCEADNYLVAMSDKESGFENYRMDILPTYKGNRQSEPPMCLPECRAHLYNEHAGFTRTMLEGDDVMGIVATHPDMAGRETIVVSMDKDMGCIPGIRILDPRKTGQRAAAGEIDHWLQGVRETDLFGARRFHMFQTLTGDTVDGYGGCPGFGPVAANKLLDKYLDPNNGPLQWADVWEAIVAEYEKKKLTEADALAQARVAFILRHSHWDSDKQRPILWTPEDYSG